MIIPEWERFSQGGRGKRQKKKWRCPKIPSKKSERRLLGRSEAKRKRRLEILPSAHARSSQANILNLDPNAAKDLDPARYLLPDSDQKRLGLLQNAFFFSEKFPKAKGSSSQKVSNGKLAFEQTLHLGDIVRSHARSPHERRRKTLACVFSRG